MAEMIRVVVDEKGNVHVEFVGYAGSSCQIEEEKLRRQLAELGLVGEVEGCRLKTPVEIEAEVGKGSPKPRGRVEL